MNRYIIALTLTMFIAVAANAGSRTVTLAANGIDGGTNLVFTVQPYETVEVLASKIYASSLYHSVGWYIMKDGVRIEPIFNAGDASSLVTGHVFVAGPAVLYLVANQSWYANNWVTLKITPETFPAQDTIVVPAGPYGAVVNLEASTNLLNWNTVFSTSHTNEPTSLFFRVRLDAASNISSGSQPAPLFLKAGLKTK